MQLSSPAFKHNAALPVDYTCSGRGVSPPLVIHDVPKDAKSLALIMHDPDAIGGQDFLHWAVWNIPPNATKIDEATLPGGALQGTNDYPTKTYGPACPPTGSGVHRYTFDLYALDTLLNLPPGAKRQVLEAALKGHTLATAQLIGTVAS